jgi:prepilin-type N-terminal cleavage/methylation domain-containing protein
MQVIDKPPSGRRASAGFTLAEVVITVAIIAVTFGGIILTYIESGERAQWSGYSLAAHALAIQQIEQSRSGVWDPSDPTRVIEITNRASSLHNWTYTSATSSWGGFTNGTLDIPVSGTNNVVATNYVTVTYLPVGNNGAHIYMVRVDTAWPFTWVSTGNTIQYFSNTVVSYCAPDNSTVTNGVVINSPY